METKKNHNEKTIYLFKEDLSKKGLRAVSGMHGFSLDVAQKIHTLSVGEVEQVAATLAESDLIATPTSIAAVLATNSKNKEDIVAEAAFLSTVKKKSL